MAQQSTLIRQGRFVPKAINSLGLANFVVIRETAYDITCFGGGIRIALSYDVD